MVSTSKKKDKEIDECRKSRMQWQSEGQRMDTELEDVKDVKESTYMETI
jgi:hypothetical protein